MRSHARPITAALIAVLVTLLPIIWAGSANAGTIRPATNSLPLPQVTVVNTDGGVYWREKPDWSTAIVNPGEGVYDGDLVELQCFEWGTTSPGSTSRLWYRVDLVNPGSRQEVSGLVHDHNVDTGTSLADQVMIGVPPCGVTELDDVPLIVFQGQQPGTGYGWHQWGNCRVQDFYNGTEPHTIVVSYPYYGTFAWVHGGMLAGWFHEGGATGSLGCPTSDEHPGDIGTTGQRLQDFDHGQLGWVEGFPYALVVERH